MTSRKEAVTREDQKWTSALAGAGILGTGLGLGRDILVKADLAISEEERLSEAIHVKGEVGKDSLRNSDESYEMGVETKLSAMREEEQNEILGLLENRRSIYSFLARIFQVEVTVDFLRECSAKDSPLIRMARVDDVEEDGELADGFRDLSSYLGGIDGRDLKQAKLELDVEYVNLFLGVKGTPAHPSESVYSSEAHLVMQKARDEVLFTYRKAGVDKVKEFTEPEDHIAIELQFMAYLCEKTAEAFRAKEKKDVEKYLKIQKEFLTKHLGVWVPELTRDVLESGTVGFYRGAAKITNGFIMTDKQNIDYLQESMLA